MPQDVLFFFSFFFPSGGTLQTKPPGASDPQETEDGALVVDVAPLSAAAQAGLKANVEPAEVWHGVTG